MQDEKILRRKHGDKNSREILGSIGELESADLLSDIPDMIRPHALKTNEVFLIFSLDVEHPNRLLFVPVWEYDACNPLSTIKEIEIVELSVDTHNKKFNANRYNL